MAKLILKVNYYKPGRAKSMGGYAKYIATRENVEKAEDNTVGLKASDNQAELIAKLVRDFPESIHDEEYLNYQTEPTRTNAREFITRTLEDNLPFIVGSPTYADYIATRPRAERIGSHGLFTSGDKPINLSKVSEELNNHQGNVWVLIASLKREDAERLGYDNASRWKDMIGGHVAQIASALNIPMEHLKWYGSNPSEMPSSAKPCECTTQTRNRKSKKSKAIARIFKMIPQRISIRRTKAVSAQLRSHGFSKIFAVSSGTKSTMRTDERSTLTLSTNAFAVRMKPSGTPRFCMNKESVQFRSQALQLIFGRLQQKTREKGRQSKAHGLTMGGM